MFRLVVTLPKKARPFASTRSFIRSMEEARYPWREGLTGADQAAEATRHFLKHLKATVKVEEV